MMDGCQGCDNLLDEVKTMSRDLAEWRERAEKAEAELAEEHGFHLASHEQAVEAWAQIEKLEAKLALAVEALEWVLRDMAYKAPEQAAERMDDWYDKLDGALDKIKEMT